MLLRARPFLLVAPLALVTPVLTAGCNNEGPKTALNYTADAKRAYEAAMEEFEATLAKEGVKSRMNPEFYERPPAEGEMVMGDVM